MPHSKGEAHPGSSSLLLPGSQLGGQRVSAVRTQQRPFLGECVFLPLCFQLSSHHTLMLLAKTKQKPLRSCIQHGHWIPLGFGTRYYRVCGVSAIGSLSFGSSFGTRILTFPLLVLAGLELGSERLLYWVQRYVRSGFLGTLRNATCSFGELGIEQRRW